MKKDTLSKMRNFSPTKEEQITLSKKYKIFEVFLKQIVSGNGMIGENYLIIWDKGEIEELNNDYETQEFLSNILLIGSDGGDMAYGIDDQGRYIEVPFIGMDNEEVKIIAKDFDEFINYLWDKE